ncbi:MAG: HDOD domain-containing protein [Desulfosarcinaceae bacterium]
MSVFKENTMVELTRCNIPAGAFRVSKGEALLMEAYLGTCVGLAIHCSESGAGGLIHFLLPEPVSVDSGGQPEKYASTGLPIFLQALAQKGARRGSMAACLAGGALVGPLSRHDMDLDIGGRTADKVREILEEEQIPIRHAETGGFFTCCLSLNTLTGAFSIEPAGYTRTTETVDVRTPSPAEIKQAMDQLKPIPQVALKLMRMMDESDYDVEAIAREIRTDQVISARVLTLANSAMFGASRSIETLDHALVYLGRDLLLKVVISAAVQSYFSRAVMGYSLCKGGLYYHALGCAQAAEALALHTGKVAPAKAYTAGLLHDIGKVVLDQYVASVSPLFYRKLIEDGENNLDTERLLLGIDHTEVGYLLGRQWSFPESIVQAIRFHHYPEKSKEDRTLVQIVYLADLLLSRFNIGTEIERVDTTNLSMHINELDMEKSDLAGMVEAIPSTVYAAGNQQTFNPV